MLLPSTHISLVESSSVNEICTLLFKKTNIKYFHYTRVKNNKVCPLVSQTDWHYYYWQHAEKFVARKEKLCTGLLEKSSNGISFSLKEPLALEHASKYFKLVDFIQLFIQIDGGYEEFAFATSKGGASSINFCLNNQDFLYKFGLYFKEKAAHLIQKSLEQEIDFSDLITPFPQKTSENLKPKLELRLRHYPLIYKNKTYILTSREFTILQHLACGYSHKIIANKLNISVKTIEFHVSNMKNKLSVFSKQALVQIFYENPISLL